VALEKQAAKLIYDIPEHLQRTAENNVVLHLIKLVKEGEARKENGRYKLVAAKL
jgi:Beta-lactamase associated winged helix domain